MSHLLRVADSEAGIAFFVTCIGQLVKSAPDYIDRTLDAVNQAAVLKQSTDEADGQTPSAEPLDIEGLTFIYLPTHLQF